MNSIDAKMSLVNNRKTLTDTLIEARKYVKCHTKRVDNNCKEITELENSLESRNLVIFAGSAISRFYPSCFPSGQVFSDELIGTLQSSYSTHHNAACSKKEVQRLKLYLNRIPFEVLLLYGKEATSETKIIKLLSELYSGVKYNDVHTSLATCLNKVSAFITPNYDTLIEHALIGSTNVLRYNCLNSNLKNKNFLRISSGNDYENLYINSKNNQETVLFKIHGSVDHDEFKPIYEINQEGQIDTWRKELLCNLVKDKNILFIGYSGMDFDILPELLKISIAKVWWNTLTLTTKDITDDARLLISKNKGHLLEGDMGKLLGRLTKKSLSLQPCPYEKECLSKKLNSIFTKAELRHWYGMILARQGFGTEAHPLLRNELFDAEQQTGGNSERLAIIQRDIGEALFHMGKYKQAYRYYMQAASKLSKHDSIEANRADVVNKGRLWLSAADALRQQGRFLMQLCLLYRFSIYVYLYNKKEYWSQEIATYHVLLSTNPLYRFYRGKKRHLDKAKNIRNKQPLASQIHLLAVLQNCLKYGIGITDTGKPNEPLTPIAFEDISVRARRIAHATTEVNSRRDDAKAMLKEYKKTRNTVLLAKAGKEARRSYVLAIGCKDYPGCAKGAQLLGEIECMNENYGKSYEFFRKSWCFFENMEASLMLRLFRWFKIHLRSLWISRKRSKGDAH